MPYFITDKSPDCAGWATVKEDGEVMGCHTTKQAAIDQMLAVSLAEDMQPGGERALNDELEVGDYVFWDNGGNTMYGEITSISTFGEVTNPLGGTVSASQNTPIATIQIYTNDNGVLTETQQFVLKGFAPLTKFDYEGQDEMQSEEDDAVRIESGPLAVIVDIDGTLISGGRLIEKTYAYIDDMTDTEIFIVTGRNDSERDSTIAELDSLGIDYDRLFMNPGSSAQTPEFKKATAETLLKEFNVILAIDNNPANRKVYRELGITALDVSDVPDVPIDQRAPAPAKDQIQGSDMNKEGSASGAGGDVQFTEAVETGLRNKVTEHNDKMAKDNKPDHTRTTLGQLKAVYRRGSGAYSASHRPGITRAQWSMARVNAFLYLLRNGRPENPAYITDFDLLPKGHPKSTRSLDIDERAINQDAPAYMRAAARRGLAYYAEGKGGDGLVDKTNS